MKKLLLLAVMLAAAANLLWADAITGPSPVMHNVTFTIIIPSRLGINIPDAEHNWTLDLTLEPTWPPAVLTPYDITNNATIQVLSDQIYTYGYTASITTPLANLSLGDFQYSETGWVPPTWTGWQTFVASGTFEAGAPATIGWLNRNMRYRVNLDGTEAIGMGIMTLVHTITQP
jgi:hypothetical protein